MLHPTLFSQQVAFQESYFDYHFKIFIFAKMSFVYFPFFIAERELYKNNFASLSFSVVKIIMLQNVLCIFPVLIAGSPIFQRALLARSLKNSF